MRPPTPWQIRGVASLRRLFGCLALLLDSPSPRSETTKARAAIFRVANVKAQLPPPETPDRLQQSRANYLNPPPVQRGKGSLQRSG